MKPINHNLLDDFDKFSNDPSPSNVQELVVWFNVHEEQFINLFGFYLYNNPRKFINLFLDRSDSNYCFERVGELQYETRYVCNKKNKKLNALISKDLEQFVGRFAIIRSLKAIDFPYELWSDIADLVVDSIWVSEKSWIEVEKRVKVRKKELFEMPEYSQRVADYLNGAL